VINKLTLSNQNTILLLSIYPNNECTQTHVFVINFVVLIEISAGLNK